MTQSLPILPGNSSFVLHEKARSHHWEGCGLLSVKMFIGGQANYQSGGGSFAVGEESYLILNHGQPYSIIIDSEKVIESFCVFFASGFAGEVYRSLTSSTGSLLDVPALDPADLNFFDRTYPHDDLLSPALYSLRAEYTHMKSEAGWLEEQLHGVMARLLQVHSQVRKEVESFPAMRASTREELYRRLHRARDYAEAMYHQSISIDEMARVACLSPNHFLRTFKNAFHQTPYQYVTSLRIERAKRLLAKTDLPVTDICIGVGFESLGSFSWLFHRRVGMAPQEYRLKSQKGDFREAPLRLFL